MEMHQVRDFLASCDTLNFTRATEHCHVSQPSLTYAIKKLEDEVGGELFHRDRKRLELTALGDMLRPRLGRIQSQAAAALAEARHAAKVKTSPLKLGVLLTVGPARFSRFLSYFQRRYPASSWRCWAASRARWCSAWCGASWASPW